MTNEAFNPLTLPTREFGADVVREAQRQYRRVLPAWASDVMQLRHSGVLRTTWATRETAAESWSMAA
ncbi:MAG: hypothetical protein HKN62_15720 [Phycisphaerales bacterium]|nr:hypothetical protein [Phycisphaerales bacterium]